jgi:DNA transformation protein
MSEFADFIQDVFRDFGEVHCRKMFGGHGVFHDGIMFGLVADDILYLKTDKSTAFFFEERDLPQFEYQRGEKTIKMSYYQAPEEIYDDPGEADLWARRSYKAALQASLAKKKNK